MPVPLLLPIVVVVGVGALALLGKREGPDFGEVRGLVAEEAEEAIYEAIQMVPGVVPARADSDPERADSDPELGGKITLSRVYSADFRPKPGEYDDVRIPSTCIAAINYCTPTDIDVPLGFPENFVPADPSAVEVHSGNDPLLVWGAVSLRAWNGPVRGKFERWAKWNRRRNASAHKALQGVSSQFGPVCMQAGFFGYAGQYGTSDVPSTGLMVEPTDPGDPAHCTFQVNPSAPRLTVVRYKDSRRLVVFVPSGNGIVRVQFDAVIRPVFY